MDNTIFLMAGNAVVWIGVCGYLAFLAQKQRRIDQRLAQMELLQDGPHE